ncbi:MAG: PEP-utilizing enzyme [archaeon]
MNYHLVYKTTTTPFFPICLVGRLYSGTVDDLVKLDATSRDVVVVIKDGAVNWFFDKRLEVTAKQLFTKLYGEPAVLQKICRLEKRYAARLLSLIGKPVETLFNGKVLNNCGEKHLRTLFSIYGKYAQTADMPGFLFQLHMSDEFKRALSPVDADTEEMFNYLISSYRKTNYELYLSAIRDCLTGGNLKKVADDFYWLIHDYVGTVIDQDYVRREVRKYSKDPAELFEHLNAAVKRIRKIRRLKEALPENLRRQTDIIQHVLYLYNEKKKRVLNRVNIYIRMLVEHRLGYLRVSRLRELYQITPDEFISLLQGKNVDDLKMRNKRWVYLIRNREIVSGSRKYHSLISPKKNGAIQGLIASPGRVKGRVNVILNISHIYKFRAGDILVAPFTNVNYLPIMHKAKAILTETGGVTSHAAIISRELGKPCIVGIQGLLMALKDGDRVEVDADTGVVKRVG